MTPTLDKAKMRIHKPFQDSLHKYFCMQIKTIFDKTLDKQIEFE